MDEPSNKQIFELLLTVSKKNDEIKEELKAEYQKHYEIFSKEINEIKVENEKLKNENIQLKARLQAVERKTRKYNLIFYNVKETEHRIDDTTAILKIISTQLKLECNYSDIRDSYRLGKVLEGRHRPIVIELVNCQLKHEILENAYKLKGSGVGVARDYIPEDYSRNKVLRKHLKLAKDNNFTAYIKSNNLFVNGEKFTYENLVHSQTTKPDLSNTADALQPGKSKTRPEITSPSPGLSQTSESASFRDFIQGRVNTKKRKEVSPNQTPETLKSKKANTESRETN